MINVKLDMLAFYLYRMDLQLLAANLDEDMTYAGMSYDIFIQRLAEEFEEFRSDGTTKLICFIGKKVGNEATYFGFEHPTSGKQLSFALETYLNGNEVTTIVPINEIVKQKNVRTNLSI